MTLHGADWFLPEYARFYGRLDVAYMKLITPMYCRRAAAMISVSKLTTDHFNRIFNLPPGKAKTVYFGPAKHFKRIVDRDHLRDVKARYHLPDQFVLTLSKYNGGNRKNIAQLFRAYQHYHGKTPHQLVVVGKDCDKFRADYGIPDSGYGKDILFPGWVEQEDLPAFYTLADLYLYPSLLEAFPIPLTEAMACGTPIITSNINGLEEIAGDAALLVDPDKAEEIAGAMYRVLSDDRLRNDLTQRGLARAKQFSWTKCGQETLAILEQHGSG
jgi:glycosyltransferase involved in cell wall biosynthesis